MLTVCPPSSRDIDDIVIIFKFQEAASLRDGEDSFDCRRLLISFPRVPSKSRLIYASRPVYMDAGDYRCLYVAREIDY